MVITGRSGSLIPEEFLQELKDRCDIESVVSKYVNLRRSGRGFVGLCPFHSEKTPSFHLYPENQSFYCFGCETGGDVITFIRKIENLDYVEAVRFLAQMAGMEMPAQEEHDGAAALRSRILELNRKAALFFHNCLLSPQGKPGRDYLEKRRLQPHTITHFGLGYAPDSWNALTDYLHSQGYRDSELIASALAGYSKRTSRCYDLFRNRVIFPIIDLRGNVIAFGGRVLDDSKPKYLNSNDTPVFKKSRCLFALNFAKSGRAGNLILCEGYMDAIALHQAGFTNAVATLGTALTPEQSRLMARYAKEVIVSYDSDEPGRNAARRAIGLLTPAGLHVRVLQIEGGKDPDEFIKTYGADRFRLMLEKCGNHIEYRLNDAMSKYHLEAAEERAACLKEAVAVLATVPSLVERDVYAGRLADKLGVDKESILADADRLAGRSGRTARKTRLRAEMAASRGFQDKINPEKRHHLLAARAEENLIVLLYRNPDFLSAVDGLIRPEDFLTAFNRRVFEAVRGEVLRGGEIGLEGIGAQFTADEMGRISALLMTRQVSDSMEEVRDCCHAIRSERLAQEASGAADASVPVDDAVKVFQEVRQKKLEEKNKTGGSLL